MAINAVYSKEMLEHLYRTMMLIRSCEESFVAPILEEKIKCPVHLYTGEEAVATGLCSALEKRDYVFGTHRSHGHYLAKGGDLKGLISEVYCKEPGCSKGRGGSMHIADIESGMIGSAPIVAGTVSLALGAALASKIRKDKRVTVSFFGDGATGEGVLFESINYAALQKLPIVFACENNLYSTHLPISKCRPARKISAIGGSFGIKSYRIDGNDVLKVFATSQMAIDACRIGKGPQFIEFLTYRSRGHVGPDDNIQGAHKDIRPREEIEKWEKRDPIRRFRKYLIKNGIVSEDFLNSLDREIEDAVKSAHVFAENSKTPDQSEIAKHVFRK